MCEPNIMFVFTDKVAGKKGGVGRVGGMNKLGGQVLLGGLGPGMEGEEKDSFRVAR